MLLAGCVAAAAWDIRARRVPNGLNAALGAAGLAVNGWLAGWSGLAHGGLGVLVAFGLILVPFAMRLYRGGDAKLVIALGAWLGPTDIAWGFGFGVVIGGVLGLLMLIGDPETRRRVGESVKAAAITATAPQVEADRGARRHVPMAVAFTIGAVLARVWRL